MFKVLVVDDEPSIRLTISEFLKRAGYETLTAHDYDSAHSLLAGTTIDLAIVDIKLPRRSSFELLQELNSC
ncbi:MAG: response regulator [Acidobacteria bacterium]|nr:response regulator [Acidobacteriota bacterium]